MIDAPNTLLAVKAERSRRRFATFFREFAWPALMPGVPFQPNWHIDAICDHLEAVKRGQIKRLIINMPFRMLKSTLVSQAFQAWDWIDSPHMQYLTASYAKDLAIRTMPDRQWSDVFGPSVARRWLLAFVGSVLTEVAGGIAGGCTASLAVSGGAVFAPGAFAFMAGMFGGGIPTAWWIYRRRPR